LFCSFLPSQQKKVSQNTLLIMDEVDGMGGGDRGGIGELILMIRKAQVMLWLAELQNICALASMK
jgi:hypothetical protein